MHPIGAIDLVTLLAALLALPVICLRWRRAFPKDVKLLLMCALVFTAAHSGANAVEWLSGKPALDVPSDYLQVLTPLFWGVFFYAFFQSTVRDDLRDSERRFRSLWDEAPAAYHMVDTEGVVLRVNRTELDMLGYAEEEMLGRPIFEFIVPEQREEARERFRRKMDGETVPKSTERLYLRKDGTRLPVTIDDRLEYDADGNLIGARSTMVSTFEESWLREELRALFEHNPVPTIVVDTRGRVSRFNLAKRHSGDRLPQIGDRMYLDYAAGHQIDMRARLVECIEKGEPKRFEEMPYGDRFLSITMAPFPGGAIIATQDVTDRKRTEQALREGERRLRTLAETVPDAISVCEWDPATGKRRLIFCNQRFVEMSGFSREALENAEDLNELVVDHRTVREIERADEHIRRGETYHGVASWKRPDGNESFYEWSVTPVRVGEKYHLFGVDRDLTELARMEAALHRTQEQFRSVLESVRDVAYKVHRRRGAFSYISPNVEELLGFTPAELVSMRAKGFMNRIHPDDLGRYRDATRRLLREPGAEETASLVEYRLRRRDGDYVWVSDSRRVIRTEDGTPRAIVGTVRDISRRKKAEQERQRFHEQMQQAQRLESLGVLAGGVAHDFNNLLTGVIGNADLALMSLPEDSEVRESLQQIQQSAEEAAEVASQMLAYSGKGQFVIEPVHLADLVREVRSLLQAAVPRRVSLEIECQQDVPTFEGDPDQIKQVVINLVTNAAEAIGEGRGTVSLAVSALEPGEAFFEDASLRGDTSAEVYTCLEVADDGCGMDRATRKQIFEPFFTTKFTGRGLGLPVVLGIARAHGGSIRVQSEPGAGTKVQVLLPAVAASETAARPLAPPGAVGASPADREHLTALVLTADPAVATIASRTFEKAGFRVLRRTAEDGPPRLRETEEHQVDIILADLSGDEAASGAALEKLRRDVGGVPLIVASDSGADRPIQKLVETGEAYILQKPYSPGRLETVVQKALAGLG